FHKHSNYIISRSSLMGFTQTEKQLIGLITRFHRKSIAHREKAKDNPVLLQNLRRINILSSCLRIAAALNRTRRKKIDRVHIDFSGRPKLFAYYRGQKPPETELFRARKQIKHVEVVFGFNLELEGRSLDGELLGD